MLKRSFAMLLAIVLVLSLLPLNVIAESTAQKNTAYTEPLAQHNHAASGDAHICEHCVAAGKTGSDAVPTWTALTGTSLPTTSGHYYLTGNVTVTNKDLTNADVVLCLNGYTVTAASGKRFYTLKQGARFTVLDCTAKTVTPENEDDTGYRAGKLVCSTDYGFMFENNSANDAIFTWYDGILTGARKTATGGLMSVQGTADVYFYGGEVRDNNTGTGGSPIYLASANNSFHAEDTAFIGNTSGGTGGLISGYKAPITLKNCLFEGNTATSNGGVFNGTDSLQITAENCTFTGNRAGTNGGVFNGKGGYFKAKNCTFTGNSAKDYSVICGTGSGVQVVLDSCRITGNSCTNNSGAVFVPNSSTPLTVKGNTYIYSNTRKNGAQGNVHLQNDNNGNYPVLTVSGLTSGAKIGVNLSSDRLNNSKILSKTLSGSLTRAQVIEYFYSDDAAYMIDLENDKLVLSQGHVHTAHLSGCTDTGCTGHENKLYLPWTDETKLPTSGSYYLDTDVALTAKVTMTTGQLDLCLNGHKITLGSYRFELSGDAALNITDCTAKTESGVYTAGRITGATNGVFQINGDTDGSGKKTQLNIFEGIICENVRTKDHAGVVFMEKKAVVNLYGGEISNNTVGATSASRGGIIYLQDNTVTFNMFGGKITGNQAVKNGTYGGNGGAIFSRDRGIVNILGGEITNNTAENNGGAIWASGGTVTVKNAKITGNTSGTGASAIHGNGGGVQITLENAEITGNTAGDYGALFIPNNGAKIIVSGTTKVSGNNGGNLHLSKDTNTSSPNHAMITLGSNGLAAGAKIVITMPNARLTAQPYATLALGGKLTEEQVAEFFAVENADWEVILKDDRLLVQEAGSGHRHCICGVEGCTEHTQVPCKPWTATDSLPTSGSYYLENDVTLTTQPVMSTGTLTLCLNGKTLNIGAKRFAISGDAVLNITDCTAKLEDDVYTAGKLIGATGCIFYMTGSSSGQKSYVNFYQGIITGNHRTGFHAAIAYLQSGATFNLYNGEITGNDCDSSADDRGGIFYIHNATGTFNMYGGTITGNKAKVNADGKGGHGGAIYNNGGIVNLQGGTITGNLADGSGAAIYTNGGTVTIRNMDLSKNRAQGSGGVIYAKNNATVTITDSQLTGNFAKSQGGAIYINGGKLTITGSQITGNEAKQMSAINGSGGGVQITLENTEITGNKATSTGDTYGALFIPNNSAKITVKGATQVANNEGGNLYLAKDSNTTSPNHPMVTVSGLTQGAKIGLDVPTARVSAQPLLSNSLNGGLTEAQLANYFFCDNDRYALSIQEDRILIARYYQDIGHSHCACGADLQGCDHEKITYLAWDDPANLPTAGNYCLVVDVKTSQNTSLTGSDVLNLCLNGHTIEAAGSQEGTWRDRIFDIKENATLNISDCTGNGQLTGGTYSAILFEDNANSTPTLNLYGGKITGNHALNHGGAVLMQGGATFNMYGGEIFGNSATGTALVNADGTPQLDADGNQKTSGAEGGGGAIALYGASTTFNMYGGKIYDNQCLRTIYLKADGTYGAKGGYGGAIYSTRGTIHILGGEISGNQAYQGGGIYAVVYSTINISDGLISENTSTHHGGGLFTDNCTVTISGGKITKNVATGSGGGIQASNSKGLLTITGGEITENTGDYGGGIMNQGRAAIVIEGGLIARNNANTAGGLYVSTLSPFTMTGGTITENTAVDNAGGLYILRTVMDFTGGEVTKNKAGKEGGGVFIYGGTLNLDGAIISGNSAKNGGGISTGRLNASANIDEYPESMNIIPEGNQLQFRPTVNLLSGEISGNSSTGAGGGMLLQGYATLNVKGGAVKNNSSKSSGGGVYASNNSTINMSGGTFSGNHGDGTGGGIYMVKSKGTFSGGVFEYNTTKKQGAGLCSSNSEVTLSGVTIRNHTHKGVGAAYTGFNSTTTMTGGSITGNRSESYGAGMYLQRGTLNLYGGSISHNSAKSQGAGVYLAGIKATIYYITMVGNKCEGSGGGALFTARWNYTENGVKKEDLTTVTVKDGLFSENYGRNGGAFLVQSGATLNISGGTFTKNEGPSAGGAIYVSSNIKFEITGGTFTENRTNNDGGAINFNNCQGVVDGESGKLVFENNYAKRYGGAFNITGDKADVTAKNLTVRNNRVSNRGGGISVNTKAHANFENVEICNNHSAIQGGGFYVGHAPVVYLKDCYIHHNTSDAAGAGVATECVCQITMENTIISENETKTKSGGIYTRAAKMHLIDCQVINNVAGGDGGGIATGQLFSRGEEIGSGGQQPGLILENTIVSGNTAVGAGGGIHVNNGNFATILSSQITDNSCGTEGSGIWTRENLMLVSTTITGNKSLNEGYGLFIAAADYDGQSFIQAVLQFGGDLVIKDNQGGDMYMGPVNAIAVTAEGITEGADFYITLDSGVLTNRLLGIYNYEKTGNIYHVTSGNRSLTEPEFFATAEEETTAPTETIEETTDESNTGLYIGIGAIGALILVAAVIAIVVKKKKAGNKTGGSQN